MSNKLDAEIANRKTAVASKVSTSTFNAHKHSIGYNYHGESNVIGYVTVDNKPYNVKANASKIVSKINSLTGTPN